MLARTVTQAEVEEWKENRVTQCLLDMFERRMLELQEKWSRGLYLSDNPHVTQASSAKAVGAHEVYRELFTLTHEDINE